MREHTIIKINPRIMERVTDQAKIENRSINNMYEVLLLRALDRAKAESRPQQWLFDSETIKD